MKFTLPILLVLTFVVALIYFTSGSEQQAPDVQSTAAPSSISYLDILNNPEFKQGVLEALEQGNMQQVRTLQAKAVEIAEVAELPQEQMNLLSGQRGLDFILFRAKRQLFLNAFGERFNRLESIESLKPLFPEAADLFAKADALIVKRDQDILEIAQTLAGEAATEEQLQAALVMARQQWVEKSVSVKVIVSE